jgi:serine/threonine protein kinase/tetratricopeptide (TPR) repeat protein
LFAKKQIPHQLVMTSARWQAIVKIFEDALEKPQGDRDEFVREACAGDADIEAEVARLLTADEAAGSFLEGPILSTLPPRSTLNRKPTVLASGSLVSGRFEVVRFIGQGGMGQVYEALDLELKGKVALKAIREDISSDPQMLARFRREVLLTRRITHPNVCRTFDIERHASIAADGTNSDITFLTMELLEGETLADLLRRQGRLATTEALPLVLQMIEALSAAHSVGIVHRDFKPSNVILVPINNGLRVVVTDFGLARAILPDSELFRGQAATSLTGSQALMGTLVYMAPEQFERGEASVASDTYSLGLVMYEMVTGERPFADAIPFAEAAKRIKQPAPSPKMLVPDLDSGWEAAICRCLQIQPEDRFEHVRQVTESIRVGDHERSVSGTLRLRGFQERLANGASPGSQYKSPWHKLGIRIAVFVLAVSLSVLFLRYYRVRSNAKLAGGSTVLLTEIQNSTGDRRFDGTTELVRHQLSQSPYFNLMDVGGIRSVLTQMTKPPDAQLDPPTAREVALRAGAPRVIFGAVSRVGDSYVLDIDIEQPDSNPRRAREQWEKHWTWNSGGTSDKEIPSGLLSAVRDSADWIRSEVGEAASDIARVDIPPQDVTTDNWDALSEFVQAEKFKGAGQTDNAIVALQNAVAVDPHFALAYTRLGDLLVSQSRSREGYLAYQSALKQEKQQHLTRREKDRLLGIYASDTEDYIAAEAAFRDYTVYYPNDYVGWFYRAYPLMMMGSVEEAITSLKKAADVDPSKVFAPALIARLDLMAGRFDDAASWTQHIRVMGNEDIASLIAGESSFLQGNYSDANGHFNALKDSKDTTFRSYGFSLSARLFAEQGQYQNALQDLDQGIAADLASGDTASRADKILDRAYISSKQGRYQACIQNVKVALQLDRSLQRSLTGGTILGQAANEATGEMRMQLTAQLREIEARLPPGDFKPFSDVVRFHLHGEIFLAEGDWKSALHEFKSADQLEPPAKDKEYLARGLSAAAQHTSDQAEAARLRENAMSAYANLPLRTGQIWQWPFLFFPGYQADASLSFVKAVARYGKTDQQTRTLLAAYLQCRANADLGLRDVEEAKRLDVVFGSYEHKSN